MACSVCRHGSAFAFTRSFGMTRQAQRINDWMGRMPAYLGYVLLGVGGLLWLFGII